mmetsp:Transcript_13404/g.34050  ORF Transcript_13404/g.34050 Transcript_13404/m.34050 type:complete len:395 (+) Transcript_13404:468-1652(+)
MPRAQFPRILQAHRADHLEEILQRVALKVLHPHRLRLHNQPVHQDGVAGGDPRGARVVRAFQRLDATQRKHKGARGVHHVGAECGGADHGKAGEDLARGDEFDVAAEARAEEDVVHKGEPVLHGEPHVVAELGRRRAGPALGAVDGDEVGRDTGLNHRAHDRRKLHLLPDAQLEPHGLPAGQLPQLPNKPAQPARVAERRMCGRAVARLPDLHPPRLRNCLRDLRPRQHPAVPGLRALADLELDHFHARVHCAGGEAVRVEFRGGGVRVAAAEVAGADVPDDVAGRCEVEAGDAALAGVVVEVSRGGAGVECEDGVVGERAVGHGGDVEACGGVGVSAERSADEDALVVGGDFFGPDAVADPLEALGVDVVAGAEGHCVVDVLCALVHDRAVVL